MTLEKPSPCKVNFILNILGRRADGFHELETVMHPVDVCDQITFETASRGIQLTCDNPELPVDSRNLVFRAAEAFLEAARPGTGIRIHLQKRIPMAAGLGGGSGNAATTLTGLNEVLGGRLTGDAGGGIASTLGSDVPFFLQPHPALATGRGEHVTPLEEFASLRGWAILLVHPGFGISTPWAYRELARFPQALNGEPGRAARVANALGSGDVPGACSQFYNSLEFPALEKFPVLALYQEFLREQGAAVALMSGSGSTTFALFEELSRAQAAVDPFKARFGGNCWIVTTTL
jgi:4-diphosphocytidyl-2-C-methyl-D-erythritol kinase